MEHFFGVMKQEVYYGVPDCSFEELNQAVDEYIYYYNHQRIKPKLYGNISVYRLLNERKAA